MTAKQMNKANPGIWVLVTKEFTDPIYIAPPPLSGIYTTDKKEEAEKWSYVDTISSTLKYFSAVTGWKLEWEKLETA